MSRKRSNRIEAGVSPVELPYIRFTRAEKESLRRLAKNPDVKNRRLCIEYLWKGVVHKQNLSFIVEMGDLLIPDKSQYVRWQYFLLLGRFAETHPETIWPQVVKWGSVKSKDIRIGVGVCILEHILEYNFSEYFEKAKALIEGGNKLFGFTLSTCWKHGQSEEPQNAKAFDKLVESIRSQQHRAYQKDAAGRR